MNKLRTLFRTGLMLALAVPFLAFGQAQNSITTKALVAGTPNATLTGRYIVPSLLLVNASASAATLKIYDQATATTNQIRPAYTTILSYVTNYPTFYTNQFGQTNTVFITGTYSYSSTVAAVTNEATRVTTLLIPASATTTIADFDYISTLGLVMLADTNLTAQITYRPAP